MKKKSLATKLASSLKEKKRDGILYAHVKSENKKKVEKLAEKSGVTVSIYLDNLIESL